MYTFCPNCHTLFRLTARHLATAGGRTRCSRCQLVYRAVDYLYEDLASVRAALLQAEPVADEPTQGSQAAAEDNPHALEKMPLTAGGWSRRSSNLPQVFSGVAVVSLALLLAGQWVFFNRADLAREPRWRPALEQFCSYLPCSLPLQVDLARFELLNRDVRQHPVAREALLVKATLANKADFTQPYPILEVRFSGLAGNPVALRRFRPKEYVSDADVIKQGMPPGKPIPIVLEIQDPGASATSYQFGFL